MVPEQVLRQSLPHRPRGGFASSHPRPVEAAFEGYQERQDDAGWSFEVCLLLPALPSTISRDDLLWSTTFFSPYSFLPSNRSDLIFPIPHLISFLSQGTTLRAGTLILTGTPAGIGFFFNPPDILLDGDEFRVEVDGGIGSLINRVEYEKEESKA